MFLAKGFLEIIFTLPIYTHLETCYDMTIIRNIDYHRGMGQHKCLYPTSRNDKYDFQSSNFLTSRPIPFQDPKVLSLPDPISSRSKKKTTRPFFIIHRYYHGLHLTSFARFAFSLISLLSCLVHLNWVFQDHCIPHLRQF